MEKIKKSILLLFLVFLGCSKSSVENPDKTPKAVDKTANLLGTGQSARDLLSNDKFSKLKIEIGYVDGFRPTQEAIGAFVDFLNQRTFKESIEVVYNRLESPGEESLTVDKISDLEEDNRTIYNEGDTMAVFIYFSDAPAEGDDEDEGLVTLGAVYRNTSMIIHEVTVRKLAGQSIFISNAQVELATLNHEFGHLFGLVNLGTDPINDHEDVERDTNGDPVIDGDGNTTGNSHCSVDGCLMRAQLQFGGPSSKAASLLEKSGNSLDVACALSGQSVLKMLEHQASKGISAPPGLDSECLLDLASQGGR
ncbi:hypothetical protein [Pareuzebyella sediminis]|uniref:hypothetical protein n=1 Tax=Pareuzebyella sediminis TaxID=2607998 RepID=UPI0011ED768D|nr:hypothetical protein [Pareuzebyella sediminis]